MSANDLQPVRMKWLAYVVWAATIVLGFILIPVVHGVIIDFLSAIPEDSDALFAARYQIGAAYSFGFVILAAIWLFFFIISTYYHFDRAGRPKSWRVLAWTVGIELLLLLVAVVV